MSHLVGQSNSSVSILNLSHFLHLLLLVLCMFSTFPLSRVYYYMISLKL